MQTIDIQFANIISPRIAQLNAKVAGEVGKEIKDEMLRNTSSGKGFGSDDYDNTYEKSHRYARRKRGLQVGTVDLRYKKGSLESVKVATTGKGANIDFAHGGKILKYHHEGTAFRGKEKGKTRSIFPKEIASIPDRIKNIAQKQSQEVLSGQK